jgi:hypothetical protein
VLAAFIFRAMIALMIEAANTLPHVTAIITLMMEAENTRETSVNFYQTTWRNDPGDGHLHTRHPEN